MDPVDIMSRGRLVLLEDKLCECVSFLFLFIINLFLIAGPSVWDTRSDCTSFCSGIEGENDLMCSSFNYHNNPVLNPRCSNESMQSSIRVNLFLHMWRRVLV